MKKIFLMALLCPLLLFGQQDAILRKVTLYQEKADKAISAQDYNGAFGYYEYALWKMRDIAFEDKKYFNKYLQLKMQIAGLNYFTGKPARVISTAREIEEIALKRYKKGDSNMGLLYNTLGNLLFNVREYEKSIEYFNKAEKLAAKHGEHMRESFDAKLKMDYVKAYISEDMKAARIAMEKHVEQSEKQHMPNYIKAEGYFYLGMVHYQLGNLAQAKQFIGKGIIHNTTKTHTGKLLMAKMFEAVGMCFWKQRFYNKSVKYYLKAKNKYKSVYPTLHFDFDFAQFKGHPIICISVTPNNHQIANLAYEFHFDRVMITTPELVQCSIHFSNSLRNNGKFQMSLESYLATLELAMEVYEDDDEELAQLYMKMGELNLRMKQNSEAGRYYTKALAIMEKIKRENDPKLVALQRKIATLGSP